MKRHFINAACVCALTFAVSMSASAALVSRLGGEAIYDTDLNITWLADADLAGYDTLGVAGIYPGGKMTWDTAQVWIAAMNTANYLGVSDWRLPVAPPDTNCPSQIGVYCIGSEMGHLFYNELGGTAYSSILLSNSPNLGLFWHLQNDSYWTGTDYYAGTNSAVYFDFRWGTQGAASPKNASLNYAFAVRTGNIPDPAVVPLPAAVWFFGPGLASLFGSMWKRKT